MARMKGLALAFGRGFLAECGRWLVLASLSVPIGFGFAFGVITAVRALVHV